VRNKCEEEFVPNFSVLSTIHTSFTVSDVGRSLLFWRDVMGYVLVRRGRASGEMVINLTGLANTDIELAVLEGAGHVIELIQYNSPLDRRSVAPRPCDIGAAHVALSVDNIDAAAGEMTQHGWKVAGAIVLNPRSGSRVAYIRDWDGITVELIESPARPVASTWPT
jgi:catechol 2,3-dioxygenase-like lactoylglutathione lyase family enzyme